MGIQLAAIDMDGTLLNEKGVLEKETANVLQEASEKGVFVVPCTGRCWDELPQELLDIKGIRYAVLSNGARIVDLKTEKTLYLHTIPFPDVSALLPMMIKTGLSYEVTYEGSSFVDDSFMAETLRVFEAAGKSYVKLLERFRFVKDLPAEVHRRKMEIEKISIRRVDPVNRELVLSFFEEHPGYTVTDFYLNGKEFSDIEINAENANKGVAIAALCEMLEIPLEEVIAIGDGHNDIPLLEAAGFGVAMSNAVEDVKSIADYITLSNRENGVATVLRKFVIGR